MTSAMSSLWRQAAWCQWRWPWWPSTCPSPSCAASTSGSGGRQSRGRETWSTSRLVRRWARDRPPGKMMPICFRVCLWLMSYYTGYFNFSGEQEDHIFTATRLSVGTFQSKWAEKSFKWASLLLVSVFQVKERTRWGVACSASASSALADVASGARVSPASLEVSTWGRCRSAEVSSRGRGRRPSDWQPRAPSMRCVEAPRTGRATGRGAQTGNGTTTTDTGAIRAAARIISWTK